MTSINTLESTVASLKERQKQLRDSHAAAVAGRTQALAQAAASSESRQRLSTECTQLRARIVPSPEEMRRLLVELSHTIESLKKENLSSNVACRETQAKSELLDKISGVRFVLLL
jgi:chromosome segregation ATPase